MFLYHIKILNIRLIGFKTGYFVAKEVMTRKWKMGEIDFFCGLLS